MADLNDPCVRPFLPVLAVKYAYITRHEANFINILFRLVIAVFTQYIVIENIIQHYMTQKMALGRALPKPILCNNPYFLVSTDRYGLRQRRL